MKVNCLPIAEELNSQTAKLIKSCYKKQIPPRVAIFTVGNDELTKIFIAKKRKLAKTLGIECEVKNYEETPLFQKFATDLRTAANSRNYHAVIIQRPLPAELSSPTLDNFIPLVKEIEAQKHKTPYQSPIGLSALSILKYIATNFESWQIRPRDSEFFKRNYKRKFVVMAGRGKTTGQPIANTLVNYKMAMVITHSQTPSPEVFYKQADVLITTTGQKIVPPEGIKEGAILLNYGYRKEDGKTKGDYVESEVSEKAAFYTPIVNGTGPVMLSYLMNNIALAYARQVK
jgi:methylenetetrahydrofolate dehydrogenase (NADP+)/methenyltetrahydrofolate cyclohydrolase